MRAIRSASHEGLSQPLRGGPLKVCVAVLALVDQSSHCPACHANAVLCLPWPSSWQRSRVLRCVRSVRCQPASTVGLLQGVPQQTSRLRDRILHDAVARVWRRKVALGRRRGADAQPSRQHVFCQHCAPKHFCERVGRTVWSGLACERVGRSRAWQPLWAWHRRRSDKVLVPRRAGQNNAAPPILRKV